MNFSFFNKQKVNKGHRAVTGCKCSSQFYSTKTNVSVSKFGLFSVSIHNNKFTNNPKISNNRNIIAICSQLREFLSSNDTNKIITPILLFLFCLSIVNRENKSMFLYTYTCTCTICMYIMLCLLSAALLLTALASSDGILAWFRGKILVLQGDKHIIKLQLLHYTFKDDYF